MDEKLLHQILLTVNEVKTVSELANLLYLSQPYVSQIITKAEGHYHVRLVNRNRVPISLTPAGAELARGLEKIIGDRIQLEHELEHYSPNQKPLIKVALAPLWTARTTTAVISELQGAFPNFQFEIQHLFTSNESLKMLENHNVDVFWGALLHGPEFNSRYLYRSRASIIIPRNHALFQKGRRKVAFSPALFHQLNNSALVSLTDNSVFQKIADHLFADDGIRVHKTIKVNDFIGACQLAIKGLGITVTLNDTLDYLNASRYEFNVMEIPRTMFNLDVGVTTNRSASPQVNEVAQKLCRVVNSANKKL